VTISELREAEMTAGAFIPARILCNTRSGGAGILMWLTPSSGRIDVPWITAQRGSRPRDRAAFPYRTHVCDVVKVGFSRP
jgi:hypothetical protein